MSIVSILKGDFKSKSPKNKKKGGSETHVAQTDTTNSNLETLDKIGVAKILDELEKDAPPIVDESYFDKLGLDEITTRMEQTMNAVVPSANLGQKRRSRRKASLADEFFNFDAFENYINRRMDLKIEPLIKRIKYLEKQLAKNGK